MSAWGQPTCIGWPLAFINTLMALILEDGTGLADANSYAAVAAFRAYWAERGVAITATDAEIEAALIRSTDYIDATYVFHEVPLSGDQALENPRDGEKALHPTLVKATIELAHLALTTNLFAPVSQRDVVEEEKQMGSMRKRVRYTEQRVTDPYPGITSILKKVAIRRNASASSMRLSR